MIRAMLARLAILAMLHAAVAPAFGQTITGGVGAGLGNVGGRTVEVCVTPNVTTGNAYGTNFVIGGKLTFPSAFTATGTGILQSVTVTIKKLETSGFTFTPFKSDPSASTWTDAAIAADDVTKAKTAISLTASSVMGASGYTVAGADALGMAIATGGTSMYGILTANAALTTNFGSATDVQVCITILQDF